MYIYIYIFHKNIYPYSHFQDGWTSFSHHDDCQNLKIEIDIVSSSLRSDVTYIYGLSV